MLRSRNVMVSGRRTSVRLEPQMWDAIHEIARREKRSVSDIATLVNQQRYGSSLTAAIRVFIVSYFRDAATDDGHAHAGHGALGRRRRNGKPNRSESSSA